MTTIPQQYRRTNGRTICHDIPRSEYIRAEKNVKEAKIMLRFLLPCDAMRCTVLVIVILSVRPSVCLSVCLSVRPSVTPVDCVHMVRPTVMISSPYGSPIILVSGDITFTPKVEGGHPERGR